MTQLQDLKQFTQLFNDVKISLTYYNENLKNELFEVEPNEDNEKAYKRGETIFDQCEEDIKNLNELINKQNEINDFFELCKKNKSKLIDKKNELINKLLRIKKNDKNVSKDEYLNCRHFWNEKRDEASDVKNRRETEEMLEEIKEERKYIDKIVKKINKEKEELKVIIKEAIKEKNDLNISDEFNKIASQYVKKNDIPITVNKERNEKYNLTDANFKQLEEWTSLKCSDILFDSKFDNWKESTFLNEKIIGKRQLIFLIESSTGEKFGYYLNTRIGKELEEFMETDKKSFMFNLQSKNNRLKEPMKFEIRNKKCGYYLYEKSEINLICIGNIRVAKESKKDESICWQDKTQFNYHSIDNALCGSLKFNPKRFVIFQMF